MNAVHWEKHSVQLKNKYPVRVANQRSFLWWLLHAFVYISQKYSLGWILLNFWNPIKANVQSKNCSLLKKNEDKAAAEDETLNHHN